MAIKLVREFKQNQQLSITPQLKKSIDLLQLSRLEIINRINNEEPPLEELLIHSKDNIDIILVEGWKFSKIKKIEVYRKVLKKEMLSSQDKSFIAIATDEKKLSIKTKIPILNINDTKQIGNFILKNLEIYNV